MSLIDFGLCEFNSEKHLLEEALHFIYSYNNIRDYSSLTTQPPSPVSNNNSLM